jgi:hypothetical protein
MAGEEFPTNSEPAPVDPSLLEATDRVIGEQVDTGVAPMLKPADTLRIGGPDTTNADMMQAAADAVRGGTGVATIVESKPIDPTKEITIPDTANRTVELPPPPTLTFQDGPTDHDSGRGSFEVPMPADPSKVPGYEGTVIQPGLRRPDSTETPEQ